MGPDEFHEKYPGAEEPGLRNNAYTNVMVAWICEQAQIVLGLLTERRRDTLRAKIGLTDDEITRWGEMSRKMFVPFHGDGIISQFEGYEDLAELDWDGYRETHGNIQRLDRILRAEGDHPDRYKLAKQADTVLLFFLFTPAEIEHLLGRLGYAWDSDSTRAQHRLLRRREPPTARRSATSPTPACSPRSSPSTRGSASWSRSRAMSATSRAARRRRASTSA